MPRPQAAALRSEFLVTTDALVGPVAAMRDVLRQAFGRATGTTPAAHRERYRQPAELRRWGSELPP